MSVSVIDAGLLGRAYRRELMVKPLDRQTTHLLERAGLFEEVGRAGYDRELAWAAKLSLGLAVELERLPVDQPSLEPARA
jgi:hypothetical protein